MNYTRRQFVRSNCYGLSLVAGFSAINQQKHWLESNNRTVLPADDQKMKALAQRALDSAHKAGADYADIRVTHDIVGNATNSRQNTQEFVAVGIRSLINGYWGFAASPVWAPEEMDRIGQESVNQARIGGMSGKAREVVLAPVATVSNGTWQTPIEINPFDVHPSEMFDSLKGLELYAHEHGRIRNIGVLTPRAQYGFSRQNRVIATSDGNIVTQQLYNSHGELSFMAVRGRDGIKAELSELTPAGVGWELFDQHRRQHNIAQLLDQVQFELSLPEKPIDVGRYDIILDAYSVAKLIGNTIGCATELDRCLGYEANASGTSYITDPIDMLGSLKVGSPLLTVTANRSEPGGAATVQWDDETVVPNTCNLVEAGIVSGLALSREMAGWLSTNSVGNRIAGAQGCMALGHEPATVANAYGGTGAEAPLIQTPNLLIHHGKTELDINGMIAGMKNGLLVRDLEVNIDFQQLNGIGLSKRVFEVRNGKIMARIKGASILFRTPELWKSLSAIGGPSSVGRYGMESTKGQPVRNFRYSVTAVPAVFNSISVIETLRRA